MNPNRTSNSTTAVGVIFYLADGTIQSCNIEAENILGYTAEQLMGLLLLNLPWQTIHQDGSLPPENHPAIASIRTGQPCSDVIMGFYKPDGDLVWISIDTLPLIKANSDELYGVEMSFVDLSRDIGTEISSEALPNKKSSEQISSVARDISKRNKSSITLFESEQRLKLATDASGIGMWFWDLVENSVEWTELGQEIFGLPRNTELTFEIVLQCYSSRRSRSRSVSHRTVFE